MAPPETATTLQRDPANRLADEHEHATSAARLATMLALVVALVLGVNALAIRLSPWEVRTNDGLTVHRKWDLASQGIPAGGIAVVGDSSGNFAVVASELEAELGAPARNLCTYGRFLVAGAGWFLDRAIECSDEPPSLVLVVLGSRTFALEADGYTLAQVPTGFGSWSGRAPHTDLGVQQMGEALVARALPLFAQHRSFERALLDGRWSIDPSVMRMDEDGSSILPFVYPPGVAPFAEKTVGELVAAARRPSDSDRAAIEGLVADADARGYDVVFVDGPVWSGLASRVEHQEFLAEVHAFIDETCARSPRAHRLGGGLQTFEAEVMENPFHLSRDAALEYTRELAARLRALGLPR